MATFKNDVVIVGNLVDVDLEVKVFQDKNTGEDYNAITGSYTLAVPTGDTVQNINLRTFAMEAFKSGNKNGTFTIMKRWIDEVAENDGNLTAHKDKAYKVSTSIGLNLFTAQDGSLVEATNIQSGFLSDRNVGLPRAEFSQDMLLISSPVEKFNSDGEPTGKYDLNVRIFDYANVCYPARFVIDQQAAAEYFESLDASATAPVLIEVWGKVVNNTIKTETVVESAFGEPHVEISETSVRENVITGAALEPKEITDELATLIKKGTEAYQAKVAEASKPKDSAFNTAPKTETKKSTGFSF